MIAFTSDFLTGIKTVDAQHEELIDLINAFGLMGEQANTKEETEKALEFLGAYIVNHFSTEEGLMVQYGYPEYDWHRTWHEGYVAKYRTLQEEYRENGPSETFTYILNEFIIKWILRHIQKVDVAFGRYVRKNMAGTRTARAGAR